MRPELLREALFSAVARGDGREFASLCQQHRSTVLESFAEWGRVPEEVRADQSAVEAWAHSIIVIAEYFEAMGHPELLESLMGGADNPIERWNRLYAEAAQRSGAGQYDESTDLLLGILSEMEGASGSGIDQTRPKVYGLLGANYFRLGDISESRRFMTAALADCQRIGDREGVRIYAENLNLLSNVPGGSAPDEAPDEEADLRRLIARAQDLSDDVRYESSNQLLLEVLAELSGAAPELIAAYRGKVHGLLGLNSFRLGAVGEARRYTELALQDCRRSGDEEGVRIYSANLKIISEA